MTSVPTAADGCARPAEWAALVTVGLISVLAQLLMTYALRFVRAAVAGVIAQFTPVAAITMGWLFLDEHIAGLALIGAMITLAGVTWGAWLASGIEAAPLEGS